MIMAAAHHGCQRFRDDLSGFVDHTLSKRRFEQVGYHLAGCASCRAEAHELRLLSDTLRARCDTTMRAPASLANRLETIAGEVCHQPLYMSSSVAGATALPSKRRRRTIRLAQSATLGAAMVTAVFILCLAVAPAAPQISNALQHAESDYSLGVTAINVNPALGAVLLAHSRGAALEHIESTRPVDDLDSGWVPISTAEASEQLEVSPLRNETFSGTQRVWVAQASGGYQVADVTVDQVAEVGSSLTVMDANGDSFSSWFVPSVHQTESDPPANWYYRMSRASVEVAGTWCNGIEAVDENNHRVARWWVSQSTGQIMMTERYDGAGRLVLRTAYTHYQSDRAELPNSAAELVSVQGVDRSRPLDRSWCQGLQACPDTLAGLPLVGHSSSDARGIDTTRLIYSDGFRHLSVEWYRGVLDGPRVQYNDATVPAVLAWQSQDGVVTLATNGEPALLTRAQQELPEPQEYQPNIWDQAGRGFQRLLGIR